MRGAPVIQDFLDTTLTRMGALARGGGAALDRRGQAAADRAEVSVLYDLGDDAALRERRA